MSTFSITNSGSGAQNIAAGSGAQYNNNGDGKQFNHSTVHEIPFAASPANEIETLVPSNGRPSCRSDFPVAIICALKLEYDAVSLLFDQFWDEEGDFYGRAQGDTNTYTTGRIGKHNIVLALLPNMGVATAAGTAAGFRSSFSGLKLALLVGVCGGVPGAGANEALLGDVVISKSLQHGLGKQYPAAFVAKDTVEDNLGRPVKDIRSLIASLETELGSQRLQKKASEHLRELQAAAAHQSRQHDYRYPGVAQDKLFAASYWHKHHAPQMCDVCITGSEGVCEQAIQTSCAELLCDESQLVRRARLEAKRSLALEDMQRPEVHIGRIQSGDTVMKSGTHRDRVAAQQDVIAFEMEGAGTWDEVPCIIIKGICDYADSHKNNIWQPFAAATAASVMKAVLGRYAHTD